MKIGIDLDGVVIDSETTFRTYEEIFDIDTLKGNNLINREEPKFQARYNWTKEQEEEFIKKYNLEGQDLVEQNIDKVKGIKFLQRNLSMIKDDHIRHDPGLVALSIIELICDDLKYQDKQNDPQYMMLSNKLREDKRIQKIQKKMEKKEKKNIKSPSKAKETKRGKSKFSSKYSERIASIKEADEKTKKKNQQRKTSQTKVRSKTLKTNVETKNKVQKGKHSSEVRRKTSKTPQEIRKEMIKELENSKLKG